MSVYTKLACFAGGALFGSFGIKLLSSKDAKKAYVHVTAAGKRRKPPLPIWRAKKPD